MRDVYWKHIAEAQERLKDQNPEDTKKEILAKARKEHQPEYIIQFDIGLMEKFPNCPFIIKPFFKATSCPVIAFQPRWIEHPERVAHMKNLTKSELSRRRLIPSSRKKATVPASTGASEESKKDDKAVPKDSEKTPGEEPVAEAAESSGCEDAEGPAPSASAESS